MQVPNLHHFLLNLVTSGPPVVVTGNAPGGDVASASDPSPSPAPDCARVGVDQRS